MTNSINKSTILFYKSVTYILYIDILLYNLLRYKYVKCFNIIRHQRLLLIILSSL